MPINQRFAAPRRRGAHDACQLRVVQTRRVRAIDERYYGRTITIPKRESAES